MVFVMTTSAVYCGGGGRGDVGVDGARGKESLRIRLAMLGWKEEESVSGGGLGCTGYESRDRRRESRREGFVFVEEEDGRLLVLGVVL